MKQDLIIKVLEEIKKFKKRNFKQSVDLIINLKNLDLKKPEHKIDTFVAIPEDKGKNVKICGLVDDELLKVSKENLDYTISKKDFSKLNKKDLKKLAREYDFFVAQATIMADIAKFFGKFLGPMGKMPNPKSGCVVPPNPNFNFLQLKERLQKMVKLQTKNDVIIKVMVGKEEMEDSKIANNVLAIYNNLLTILPEGKNNIKNVLLKLTMSKAVKVEDEKKG